MNRLAIQESAARQLAPAELVVLAHRARFHSVGIRVAHTDRDDAWRMGAAAPELREMVDQLLTLRVSVLDVGQLELGRDSDETWRHVLDLAGRLGARYVTAFASPRASEAEVEDLFGELVQQSAPYQLIPLLALRPETVVDTAEAALAVNRRVGGATVLTVDCGRRASEIESMFLDAGQQLGYLRVLAEQLDELTEESGAGLLATLPAHVPVAVGSNRPGTAGATDLADRATRWSSMIDLMLEHPRSRAFRLGGGTAG